MTDVVILNLSGDRYSDETLNTSEFISADGRILYAPENAVYELKFSNLDIVGTIK